MLLQSTSVSKQPPKRNSKLRERFTLRPSCTSDDHNTSSLNSINRRETLLRGLAPMGVGLFSINIKQRSTLYDKYFSYVLSHLSSDYDEWIAPYKSELFNTLATKEPIRVLEIGVGTGMNFEFYASRAPNVQIVGLDPNPEMRPYSELAASTASLRNFEFVADYANSIPYGDASFDFVVSTLVLCSVEDVAGVLNEVQRVLKPGGQFLFLEHVAAAKGSRTRLAQTIFNPLQQLMADNCHLTRDTLSSIEATGFRKVEAQSINIEKASFLAPHIVGVATV